MDRRSGWAELLSMENPESPSVDIGANSFAYRRVARAISNSYEMLTAKLSAMLLESPGSGTQPSLLSLIIDVDAARSSAKHQDSATTTKRKTNTGGGKRRRGKGRGAGKRRR